MADIKLIINRDYQDAETLGHAMVIDDDKKVFKFKTIELPLHTPQGQSNVPSTNCIPEGTYRVTRIWSPTKGNCFQIHDVEGRTAILIHKGNYATGKKVDTQGCILVGSKFADINNDGELDVIESTITMDKLLSLMPNEFVLTIG